MHPLERILIWFETDKNFETLMFSTFYIGTISYIEMSMQIMFSNLW